MVESILHQRMSLCIKFFFINIMTLYRTLEKHQKIFKTFQKSEKLLSKIMLINCILINLLIFQPATYRRILSFFILLLLKIICLQSLSFLNIYVCMYICMYICITYIYKNTVRWNNLMSVKCYQHEKGLVMNCNSWSWIMGTSGSLCYSLYLCICLAISIIKSFKNYYYYFLEVLAGKCTYTYTLDRRPVLSSSGEGHPLRPSSQLREGRTWIGEGGRGHPPSQAGQPNQPWWSMGWQMLPSHPKNYLIWRFQSPL